MTYETDKFRLQSLRSLLRSQPGTIEEIRETRHKVDAYFRELEKSEVARNKLPPGHRAQASNPFPSEFVKFPGILLPVFLLMVAAIAVGAVIQSPGPVLFVLFCGFIVALTVARFVRRAVSPMVHNIRQLGERGPISCQEKWTELLADVAQILLCTDLPSAFNHAENGLARCRFLSRQLDSLPTQTQPLIHRHHKSEDTNATEIDPLNTLIEVLIESDELTLADRLSQHYLALLTKDIQ